MIELLLALAVGGTLLAAAVNLLAMAQRYRAQTHHLMAAVALATQTLDQAFIERAQAASAGVFDQGIYHVALVSAPALARLSVTVSWTEVDRRQEVTLSRACAQEKP